MSTPDTTTPKAEDAQDAAHPLALIASTAETEASTEAQALEQGQEQTEAGASLTPELMAGLKLIPLACLRMLRGKIAQSTPEILKHWGDEVLDGPASAVPPLLMRYASSWAPVLGANPELTVFAIACVPLGMGYLSASSENAARRAEVAKAGQGSEGATLAVVQGGQDGATSEA